MWDTQLLNEQWSSSIECFALCFERSVTHFRPFYDPIHRWSSISNDFWWCSNLESGTGRVTCKNLWRNLRQASSANVSAVSPHNRLLQHAYSIQSIQLQWVNRTWNVENVIFRDYTTTVGLPCSDWQQPPTLVLRFQQARPFTRFSPTTAYETLSLMVLLLFKAHI